MLGQDDLLAWFQRLSIPEPTCSMINHIRSSGPSRRVGGGRSNVSGRYPSRKMGVTIQFESHRVELAGIYEMEHDATVLEYFDQPPAIKLDYESAAGKRMGVLHTPDFFVIRRGEAGWEEWKTEEELRRLNAHNPNRYSAGRDEPVALSSRRGLRGTAGALLSRSLFGGDQLGVSAEHSVFGRLPADRSSSGRSRQSRHCHCICVGKPRPDAGGFVAINRGQSLPGRHFRHDCCECYLRGSPCRAACRAVAGGGVCCSRNRSQYQASLCLKTAYLRLACSSLREHSYLGWPYLERG